jgi:hypothetical protein
MKNYLVLYNPGLCGTFLTWLITQHKNFPLYNGNMKKYTNDLDEIKTLDIACSGGDWYINKHISKDSDYYMDIDQNGEREWVNSNLDKGESLLIWSFEENRRIRPIGERNNISFTKDCVKINPNHNLVNDDHVSLGIDYVDKELFKRVTDDMQPEKIIVPIFNSSDETLVKRWIMYRVYHNKFVMYEDIKDELLHWQKNWHEWSDYVVQDKPYGENVHYVDIEKLTTGDNDEYLKLCEAIDETPIDNIQEDITAYRNILSEVAEHYDRINR